MAQSGGNSAAAKPDEHASCIRVTDAETAAPYYISAVFRSDADGEECFDLTVTDLKRAWTASGIRRPATSVYREQWLEVAREALTGVPDAALRTNKSSYRWNITESSGHIKLGWVFEIWRKDREQRDKLQTLKGHVEAAAADDAAAIVERLVSQLVVNAQTYKASYLRLRAQAEGFQQETQKAQDLLQKAADEREKKQQQLFIKFAAVLNESKKKCREWQAKAQQAEERLETGDATDNGSEATSPTERSSDTEAGEAVDEAASKPASEGDVDMAEAGVRPDSAPAPRPEPEAAAEPELESEVVARPKRRAAPKKRRVVAQKLRPEDTLGQTDLASQR